jgi:p-aminobenzoyl-glutamate transporter AbgT
MTKAWDLIFVGEGGALWPLLAWSLLTDSIAVWLSQRMHRVDAADFMRFICFVFLCSSLRSFVCFASAQWRLSEIALSSSRW